MTRSRPPQFAFSSGEISPLLHSRQDYQRYQTGLNACIGFLPLRQGGITRAPGTIFRGYTRNNNYAVRIPFVFAENDAVELEFSDGYMRVWRYGELIESGGSPYELATPYGENVLDSLQFVQSADVIYIADGLQPVQKLSRLALDNWTIAEWDLETGPFRVQNLDEAVTIQCSGVSGSITLTGVGTSFSSDWVGSLLLLKPTDFSNVSLWTGNTAVSAGDKMRYGDYIYELVAGTNTGVNPPVHTSGTRLVDKTNGTKWKYLSDTRGIVQITAVASATSATAQVLRDIPQPCVDDPTYRWSEGAWSDRWGYPASLEIFGQSVFAAKTPSDPRTIWWSTIGDFNDFLPSSEADGSGAYTISGSKTQNSIRWLHEARRGIYIGALGEVFRGYSNAAGQAIGPTTFDTDVEDTDGCNAARPITPYGYPIYITRDGGRVHEARYSFEEDGGKPKELSLPSEHLGAEGFLDIVWQSAPQKYAWLRRGDGSLAVMLYDPDEEVLGWARVPVAGGFVEAITVTPDPDTSYDILTMHVRRTINGQTVRMVEEQAVTWGVLTGDEPISKAVHFFASSVFDPIKYENTFSVPHLVGEEVYVWTDRGEFGPIIVPPTGEITIGAEVSHAVVGLLDETHRGRTLNIPAQAPDGSTLGRYRRLNSGGGIIMHRTAAGKIRTIERDFGQPERISAAMSLVPLQAGGDLVQSFSGVATTDVNSGNAQEVAYEFLPVGGAPMTITGLVPDISEAGA